MNTGILLLADLASRAPWFEVGADWGAGALLPPTVLPPPGLVLVVDRTDALRSYVGWLQLARRVAIVLALGPGLDRDLAEVAELEVADFAEQLGNVVQTVVVQGDPRGAVLALLPRVAGAEPWPSWEAKAAPVRIAPGPWISWDLPRFRPKASPNVDLVRGHLAAGLGWRGARPGVFDAVAGAWIDLQSGARSPVPGLAKIERRVSPLVDGRWFQAAATGVCLNDGARLPGGWGEPISVDPSGRIAWVGGRSRFHWRIVAPAGPVYWTDYDHDWPCGHAKKLYGYDNNYPLQVVMSPDAEITLSTYEHDALICPGPPLRWRDCGGTALAERHHGEPRALFYERADEGGQDGDPSVGDEDARDASPVVALGPDAARRYTVGLARPTWRLRGELGVRLGGPDEGWVTFDAEHRVVDRGPERLLAGYGRWLLVEVDPRSPAGRGAHGLWRLDGDGGREPLGSADWPGPAHGAIPAGENALLWAIRGNSVQIRVV